MKKDLLNTLKILTVAIILSFSISAVFAQWVPPTQAPPGGNVDAPINVGATGQVKDGNLGANGLLAANTGYFGGNVEFAGNVGIGTAAPTQALDVVGNVNSSGSVTASSVTAGSASLSGNIAASSINVSGTGAFNSVNTSQVNASQINLGGEAINKGQNIYIEPIGCGGDLTTATTCETTRTQDTSDSENPFDLRWKTCLGEISTSRWGNNPPIVCPTTLVGSMVSAS